MLISSRSFFIKMKKLSIISVLGFIFFSTVPSASVFAQSTDKPIFQFGLVPDVQYCDCNTYRTRYYRNSVDKLLSAAQTLNQQNVDFTVQLGDLIDKKTTSFSTILPVINKIKGQKYHVLGNHDFAVPIDQVVHLLGMPKQYYDFKYSNWRFIVLDTNDVSFYANPIGSQKYRQAEVIFNSLKVNVDMNVHPWNGAIGHDQLTWLRAVLYKASKANEKVIVFGHMPLYPESSHNIWNDYGIITELEAAGNVVAYFNGHNHAGNYAIKNGIHYVNLKGMVETADTTSYAIVGVYKDHLKVDGFGREPDRLLLMDK